MIDNPSLQLRPEIETELRIQAERLEREGRADYLTMRVRDVVAAPAILLPPSTLVIEAIRKLAKVARTSALVVDSRDRLLGIVTLEDLAFDGLDSPSQPIANVMSSPEVVHEDDALSDALRWMLVRDFRQVPVVDAEGRARAMIRIEDALREITAPHARHIATRPADPVHGYVPRYGG